MEDNLKRVFSEVFSAKWQAENHPCFAEMLEKFVFHMSDAMQDLRRLVDALQMADVSDRDKTGELLHQFFLHALPHLVSAGQLYDYVPDIFPEQRGVHDWPPSS